MVGDAAFMLVLQTCHVLRIEKTAAAQPFGRQKIVGQRTQLTFQPGRKRNPKTFLTTPPDKRRHQPFRGPLENVLRSITMQFVTRGQRGGKFSHPWIEVWR